MKKKKIVQKLTKDRLDQIINKHPSHQKINTFLETGTHLGGQIDLVLTCPIFKSIHTIELNDYYYEYSSKKFKDVKKVTCYKGDSVKLLPSVIKNLKDPMMFYLDAHFCQCEKDQQQIPKSAFPLFQELDIIKNRNQKDIIAIDDVHTFGIKRWNLQYNRQKDWELVNPDRFLKFLKGRVFDSQIIDDSFVIWLN